MIADMINVRDTRSLASVRAATARHADPEQAVQALFAQLDVPTLSGLILFCASRYDVDRLAAAILPRCEGLTVIGCTSSGEITPGGFEEGSIVAIGFPICSFALAATRFDQLDRFGAAEAQQRVRSLVADAAHRSRHLGEEIHQAAIFLVDGLSHREEMLTVTLQDALGHVPLIGGSSGDGMAFRETFVLDGDGFRRDAAVVAVLSTCRKLHAFRSQPYVPGEVKMVITGADPVARVVSEINAEPAVREYARLVGVRPEELRSEIFAARPPMVRAGGEYYVRSIQSANPDGSLTFYCAIDEGVVLTLGEAHDVVDGLARLFRDIDARVGGIDHILGFNCVLNHIDMEQRQLLRPVAQLMQANRVAGFNTYGEQFHALHVNQTFTGLAIGR